MKISKFDRLEDFFEEIDDSFLDKMQLIIVCNTKSETNVRKNYNNFDITTEFLSDEELAELSDMAYRTGLPFQIFHDEQSFIKAVLSKNENILKRLLVYNSAQNGIGPGRKSLIPSVCNLLGIRYTGSDSYRVSLCRDKFAVNTLLHKLGLPVPQSFLFRVNETIDLPQGKYIAKPLYESASIGISDRNVFEADQIPYLYFNQLSENLRQPLLLQKFICGYEIEVPVLIHKEKCYCFEPVLLFKSDLNMGDHILNYDEIYRDDYCFGNLPKTIRTDSIRDCAIRCADALGLNGLCRIDLRLTAEDDFYITDVSTNPHFVKHSSVNFAFSRLGHSDKEIFKTILKLCN